jgi:hypothetical protein
MADRRPALGSRTSTPHPTLISSSEDLMDYRLTPIVADAPFAPIATDKGSDPLSQQV